MKKIAIVAHPMTTDILRWAREQRVYWLDELRTSHFDDNRETALAMIACLEGAISRLERSDS